MATIAKATRPKLDPRRRTTGYLSERVLDALAGDPEFPAMEEERSRSTPNALQRGSTAKGAKHSKHGNGHAPTVAAGEPVEVALGTTAERRLIPIKQLEPSPSNPRKRFDEEALKKLAADLKVNGLIQDLVVRLKPDEVRGDNKPLYEIVCGERRFRAAKLLGWPSIRCRVVDWADEVTLERQIAENDQRSDLTEIERAEAYQRLLDTGLTQAELAVKLGRTQGFVANCVGLLKLPMKARAAVESGLVSATCARLLVPACHVPAIVDDMLKWASHQHKRDGHAPTVKEWEPRLESVINNHTVPLSGRKWIKDERSGGSYSKEWRVPVTDENREALALVPGKYGKRSANPKLVAKLKAEQTRKANARAAKAAEGNSAAKKSKARKNAAQNRYEAAQAARQARDAIEQLVEDVRQLAIAQALSYTDGERPDEHVVLRLLIFAGIDPDWDRPASVFPELRRYGRVWEKLSKVPDGDLSATALRLVQALFVDTSGPTEFGANERVEWAAKVLGLTDVRRNWLLAVDHPWLKKEWPDIAKRCGRDDDEQKAGPPAKCPEWLLPPAKPAKGKK